MFSQVMECSLCGNLAVSKYKKYSYKDRSYTIGFFNNGVEVDYTEEVPRPSKLLNNCICKLQEMGGDRAEKC